MMVAGAASDISMMSLEHQHDEGEQDAMTTAAYHYSLEQILEAATVLLRARAEQPYSSDDDESNHFCHPTLDEFEPYVPRCRTSAEHDDSELWHWHSLNIRRMQQDAVVVENGWEFYATNVGGALLCIAAVALIAGLFLGYLTLDAFDLRIIERASLNFDEREYARTILPIVVERHRVLVTLLILNGLAYETCECYVLFMYCVCVAYLSISMCVCGPV
jgi:hypothetical protein